MLPETDLDYFGDDGERMHMMFNFQVNQHLFYALATADTRPLVRALKATKPRPATAQWGMFLRNHDELDLGRLEKSQREKVFREFGPEKDMQLYDRGIRRRLAPMLGGDQRRLELAYSLMFTLPGTPVIRYGDELGMGDNLDLPERNCTRTPMQWSTEPNGGFTKNKKPHHPVIAEGPYGYERINAAVQRRHPDSMLNWTERIIRMRKEVPEIGWGDFAVLKVRTRPCSPCVTTGGITRLFSCTTCTPNRASFISTSSAERKASFSLTYLPKITAKPGSQANIALCSKVTAIAGIASAVSIIY